MLSNIPFDNDRIDLLNNIALQLNRYISIIIFIFGVTGNLINTSILSQRALRSNPCIFYFQISTIAGLFAILCGLSCPLIVGWIDDPMNTIGWLCKCRSFILYVLRAIFLWLIMLATLDLWLSSCYDMHWRQKSTLKNARRSVLFTVILAFLFNIHLIYCYDANQIGGPVKCYGKTTLCRIWTDFIYSCIMILLPLIVMIIFGLLIIRNIHRSQRVVHIMRSGRSPIGYNIRQQRWKKIDRQLIIMLLSQVILLLLLTSPHACQKIYLTITFDNFKSDYEKTVDSFVYTVVATLTFLSNGIPFYLYTLTGGRVFRKELFNVIKLVKNKMKCLI